jgi:hypothetical protein
MAEYPRSCPLFMSTVPFMTNTMLMAIRTATIAPEMKPKVSTILCIEVSSLFRTAR